MNPFLGLFWFFFSFSFFLDSLSIWSDGALVINGWKKTGAGQTSPSWGSWGFGSLGSRFTSNGEDGEWTSDSLHFGSDAPNFLAVLVCGDVGGVGLSH